MEIGNYTKTEMQKALKKRFKGSTQIRSKVKPTFPDQAEREYLRALRLMIVPVLNQIMAEMPKALKTLYGGPHGRMSFEENYREMTLRIMQRLERTVTAKRMEKLLDRVGNICAQSTVQNWKSMVRSTLGVDIFDDFYKGDFYMQELLIFKQENQYGAGAVPREMLDEALVIILECFSTGVVKKDVLRRLDELYEKYTKKVGMEARNAVANLSAGMRKRTYESSGVTAYIWVTRRDNKVRECHKALDNTLHDFDHPPQMWYRRKDGIVMTGRYCHPGQDYGCRCGCLPIFDTDRIDLPVKPKEGA